MGLAAVFVALGQEELPGEFIIVGIWKYRYIPMFIVLFSRSKMGVQAQ